MNEIFMNIVAFNVPYPPDYGGVIDVFYKLKALYKNNVRVILHTFHYGREEAEELEKYCYQVFYYKRKTGFASQLSFTPYIIYSRRNKELLYNLQQNTYPILFEGLHTCYYLNHPSLAGRKKIVRAHNIEHLYYKGLTSSTKSLRDKVYFAIEAYRLRKYEKKLNSASYILALSTTEYSYFSDKYGKDKTKYVPLFFNSDKEINISNETKPYVLYHADLSTPENIRAATYLLSIAGKDQSIQWVFAGRKPDKSLVDAVAKYPNVTLKPNPDNESMHKLVAEAAINILYTDQVSGVKLKLLNTLYNGHTCLVNDKMVVGSGLESLCKILPDDSDEILNEIRLYMSLPFDESEVAKRKEIFSTVYNNDKNAMLIKSL
ncbi:glycosyltransferase involved in cell wall biosynthesis [Dysgonomonadaceae bacterium PH5-43]|nr:glycosyltransferase involved in cell wall biosynthesis [Dysgonomonadaceae bacterium PH5-43]